MPQKYKTILQEGIAELTEKKSKFIAFAIPVSTELEAQNYLESLRKKYWDARHVVYAYRIGLKNETVRYSDDGEPPGTAGMPVLDVLRGQEIQSALVAVVRYFGGTLLGTGGLVRAYSHSALMAVNSGTVIEKSSYQTLCITTGYGNFGKIQYAAMQNGCVIQDTVYTDRVELTIFIREEECPAFCQEVCDLTAGQGDIQQGDLLYGAQVDGKLMVFQD